MQPKTTFGVKEIISRIPRTILYMLLATSFGGSVIILTNEITTIQQKIRDQNTRSAVSHDTIIVLRDTCHSANWSRPSGDSIAVLSKKNSLLVSEIKALKERLRICEPRDIPMPPDRPEQEITTSIVFGSIADTISLPLNCKPDEFEDSAYKFSVRIKNNTSGSFSLIRKSYEPFNLDELLDFKVKKSYFDNKINVGEEFTTQTIIYSFRIDRLQKINPFVIFKIKDDSGQLHEIVFKISIIRD